MATRMQMCPGSFHRSNRVDLFDGSAKLALDIGSAHGFMADLLSKLGYCAFGVDVSDRALREGRSLGIGSMIHSDASDLPYRANSFNLVTCFEVLQHLYDPEGTLRAIGDLTKDGGTFLMTTPTVTPFAHIMTFLVAETHSGHPSMKRPEDWVRIVEENGFKAVKAGTFSFLPVPPTIFDRYFTIDCKASPASHVRIVAQKD